jgi:conjugal transfer pilus assembly protein TraW
MIRRAILAVAILPLWIVSAQAKDLGSFGRTYPVTEKDALAEIEERARQVDWSKVLDKKKLENYQGPPDRESLPRAKRNRTFLVDMTYTTEIDVPDGKGGILYPKGYTFNPLDYVTYPKTIIVINGNDRGQVAWFKDSEYSQRLDVTLLITEGAFGTISKQIDRTVSYANNKIISRFQLKAVPSIIRQKGRLMEVSEVALPVGKHTAQKAAPDNN